MDKIITSTFLRISQKDSQTIQTLTIPYHTIYKISQFYTVPPTIAFQIYCYQHCVLLNTGSQGVYH